MSVDLLSYVERPGRPGLPHVAQKAEQTVDWRRLHLDAAQWPAACGYDQSVEPIELFAQLTGVYDIVDVDEVTAAIEEGLRPVASRHIGRDVATSPTFIHPRYEWCTATPHGLCDDGSGIIVATQFIELEDFDAKPPTIEDWGRHEEDVPVRILVRALGTMTVVRAWQMAHTPSAPLMTLVHVGALVGGRFRMFRVFWDEDLARRLFDRIVRFWAAVKIDQPPPKRDTEAFYAYIQKRYPQHTAKKWVEADEQLRASVIGWSRIDAQIQDLKRQRHAAKNEICARVRDAEGICGVDENGVPWRLPWRAVRGAASLNKSMLDTTLRHLLGDAETERILGLCMTRGEGHRKLGPKWEPKTKATLDGARAVVVGDDEGAANDER